MVNSYNRTVERAARCRPFVLLFFLVFCAGVFPFCLCAQSPSAVATPVQSPLDLISQAQIQAPPTGPQQPQEQPQPLLPSNTPAPGGPQLQPAAVMPTQPLTQPQPEQAQGAAQPGSGLQQTVPQAQPLGAEAPRPPVGRRAPIGQSAAPPSAARGQFSFNFDDADVFSVIQTIFGDVLKVNYVVDPKVKGRVTFRSVAPVPLDNVLPLMEVILRLNGIAVVDEAGLYRIVPLGDLAREPSAVGFGRDSQKVNLTGKALLQVIPINYMASSEIVKLVTPFLSTNAVIVDVPKINYIIVVDTDANVKRILSLVDIFDSEQQKKKRPQVFVFPVQNGKAKDITALLQQIFLGARAPTTGLTTTTTTPSTMAPQVAPPSSPMYGSMPQTPGAPGSATVLMASDITRIFANDGTNSIVVLAIPEDYQVIKETIEKIDVVPRQVLIEGLIAQVQLNDNLSLGVAWAMKTNIGGLDGLLSSGGDSIAGVTDPTKPSGTGFTFVGSDSRGAVKALVTALATESRAKLLASPHILVSDNREARIQVGQSVPLVTAQTYGAVGVAPQQVVEYKDIGIILKVKPQVNEGGLVNLELHQEVSTFTTQELFAASTQIIINKTEATSNLVVQDGQTIVMGGLIREDTSKSVSGIPYLSKIPILGYLFGSRSAGPNQRIEIIMLLTPHVLKSQKDAGEITSDYVGKFTERGNVKKEELRWVNPPRETQGAPENGAKEKDK
jgi:type II secretory pathway component GspD/PulD (secretin)